VDRNETIAVKIKALWALKEKKAWPRDPDVSTEVMAQYIGALSKIPTKEIPVLLDYFFSDHTTSMPQPFQITQLWTKQGLEKQNQKTEPLKWSDIQRSATSPYAKGIMDLLKRRFGYPVSGTIVTHKNRLNQEDYITALKELGVKHNVPWDEENYQRCLPIRDRDEKWKHL